MLGNRLVMIEHLGRVSGERRFVVVEVVGQERNVVRVASGFGHRAQWYRNIQANGVAYISIGRFRRVKAHARLLGPEESAARLADYARAAPDGVAAPALRDGCRAGRGMPTSPSIEFVPPRDPSALDAGDGRLPRQSSTSPRSYADTVSSWSYVQDSGSRSGRQRSNCTVWRNRQPSSWS